MINTKQFDYPPEATIGDQWARGMTQQHDKMLGRSQIRNGELHRCIARVAYQLYLRRGKQHGHHVEDWLAAEALVLSFLRWRGLRRGIRQWPRNKMG
jgi:hypothetical protein